MRKTILTTALLALCLGMGACTQPIECQESVQNAFPDSEVVQINEYRFVVRDKKGDVWYVETLNPFHAVISGKILLSRAK
ncbi:MAG: hypothetical protein KGI71_06200 [Patescibacteria group bacterium]|nr:hypothetical protein [Patescibacteria group bacterium]